MSNGAWILLAVAMAGSVWLAAAWRGVRSRLEALEADHQRLAAERDDLAARLARESAARKKQSEALATQRKKADKARKRKARDVQALPLGTASRVADLEEQIERLERERDRGRVDREQLMARVASLEAQVEVARAAPTAEESAGAVAEVGADRVAEHESAQSESAALRERSAKLEEELALAKQTEARMRKRMSNQEQLYASMRAELEVKKDRLRAQEERIQRLEALQVAVSSD
jgi:chromosome segregation ATPase